MEDIQNQMNNILQDPEMMHKIMQMAQSLNQQTPNNDSPAVNPSPPSPALPNIDPAALRHIAGLAGQTNIDNNQRSLLKALTPYLSRERITKLERAMRAAKLANLASGFLGRSGSLFQSGR